MQVIDNTIAQKFSNIEITWEQSTPRIAHVQNNENDTLRWIIFDPIQDLCWGALWKVVQIIMKLRELLTAWTRKQVRTNKSFQKDIFAAMIGTQIISNGLHGFPIHGSDWSRSTDTQKIWIPHSCSFKNSCKNQLRETVQLLRKNGIRLLMIGGLHQGGPIILGGRVQDGLGLIIYSRFSHPNVFCVSHPGKRVRTQVVETTVCATWSVHTAVARTCCVCMAQGELSLKKVFLHCACRVSSSRPRPLWCVSRHLCCSLTDTSTNTFPVLHRSRV